MDGWAVGPDELERRRVDLLECFVPGLLKLVITGVSEGIGSVLRKSIRHKSACQA